MMPRTADPTFDLTRVQRDIPKRRADVPRGQDVAACLSEISDVTIDAAVDRASGVEVCHTMLIMKDGKGWAFPAADKTEAETNAAAVRDFLAITT
jgi:hypothetical protein